MREQAPATLKKARRTWIRPMEPLMFVGRDLGAIACLNASGYIRGVSVGSSTLETLLGIRAAKISQWFLLHIPPCFVCGEFDRLMTHRNTNKDNKVVRKRSSATLTPRSSALQGSCPQCGNQKNSTATNDSTIFVESLEIDSKRLLSPKLLVHPFSGMRHYSVS